MDGATNYYEFEQNGNDGFFDKNFTITNADYVSNGHNGYAIRFDNSNEKGEYLCSSMTISYNGIVA